MCLWCKIKIEEGAVERISWLIEGEGNDGFSAGMF